MYYLPATARDAQSVGTGRVPRAENDALSEAIGALLLVFTDRPDLADIAWPWPTDPAGIRLAIGSWAASTQRPLTRAQADAIRATYRAANAALDAAYANGLAHGTDLLRQLADGRITMDQFGDRSHVRPPRAAD